MIVYMFLRKSLSGLEIRARDWMLALGVLCVLPSLALHAQNAGAPARPSPGPAPFSPVGPAPFSGSQSVVPGSGIPANGQVFSPSAPTIDPRTGQTYSQPYSPNTTLPGAAPGATGRMFTPNSRFSPNNTFFPSSPYYGVGPSMNFGVGPAGGSQGQFAPYSPQFFDAAGSLQPGNPGMAGAFGYNGTLGLQVDSQGNRLQVTELDRRSFAAAAGFQVGDQILGVNRTWATSPQAWQDQLSSALRSDGRAWVAVSRNGVRQWINVDPSGTSRGILGLHVFDNGGIVRVALLSPGSVALRAGLQPGDVILSANGAPITSNAQLVDLSRTAAAGNGELNLVVRRNGYEQTIRADLKQNELALQAAERATVEARAEAKVPSPQLSLTQLRNQSERLRTQLRGYFDASGRVLPERSAEAKAVAAELLQTLDAIDRPRQ